jgi:hypothetical protein
VIRHREVDTSSPEGPGFNFLDADLNEALHKIQDRPAQFAKRHYATDGRVGLGQKRTFNDVGTMSASPSKADIKRGSSHVRLVPEDGVIGLPAYG